MNYYFLNHLLHWPLDRFSHPALFPIYLFATLGYSVRVINFDSFKVTFIGASALRKLAVVGGTIKRASIWLSSYGDVNSVWLTGMQI